MPFTGFSHVSLTVTDLERSRAFYGRALGWREVRAGRSEHTTFALGKLPGGTTVVLRVHDEPAGDRFDERRPGLDHISFAVDGAAELQELEHRLGELGATFTPARDLGEAKVLAFRDPDNIALEAFLASASS